MASKRVALELAAPWLPPDCLAPVAAAGKELKALIESNAFWTDFYRRRFPCLATLENYASPSDARALVKGLLHAAPPPYCALPACPRDASGRALPLRGEVILAVQLSVRSTGHAFAYGARRLSELDLYRKPIRLTEVKDWMFDMPMDHIDQDFVDGVGLAAALSLPQQIVVSPEPGPRS